MDDTKNIVDLLLYNMAKAYTDKKCGESSGGNADLGITGAEVGQTIKVSAVDENGKPTAWEPADLEVQREWKLLLDVTTEEEVASVEARADMDGNPFSALGFQLQIVVPQVTTSGYLRFNVFDGTRVNGAVVECVAGLTFHSFGSTSGIQEFSASVETAEDDVMGVTAAWVRANLYNAFSPGRLYGENFGDILSNDYVLSKPPFTKFKLVAAGNGVFPVGTHIRVYKTR